MKNCDLLEKIDTVIDGVWFDHIEGYSCVGDVLSNAYFHPIQYVALTNIRQGDDDPFTGIGWTTSEALRNLYKALLEVKNRKVIGGKKENEEKSHKRDIKERG